MKTLHAIAAAAFLFADSAALASENPRPTAQDSRIREAIFSETQVFRIVGVYRSATQIVFDNPSLTRTRRRHFSNATALAA